VKTPMLISLPSTKDWMSHLRHRLDEAIEIQLIASTAVPFVESARVIVPSHIDLNTVAGSDPRQSLHELLGDEAPSDAGWVKREDLFKAAAEWLCRRFKDQDGALLVCGAGLARVGDVWLDSRPHIVHGGRPFLHTRVQLAAVDRVSTTLRWGRSWEGFLGLIVSPDPPTATACLPAALGLFIFDAFDGDSLAVVSLGRAA
jgi:hypothetical protein